jgi:hypothetical protein
VTSKFTWILCLEVLGIKCGIWYSPYLFMKPTPKNTWSFNQTRSGHSDEFGTSTEAMANQHPICIWLAIHTNLSYISYIIWLVVSTPLKNMSSSVGIMKFPTEWKNKIHVPIPNHQPDFFSVARWEIFHFMKFINACEIYIHARRWRSFPQSISWINSETYPGLCCWKCSSTVDEVCQKGKIHEMSPVHSCKRKQTQFQETSKWGPCSSWISDMQFSSFCSSWVSRIHLNQTILMVVAETSILNQNHCWLRHTGWTHPWKKRRFDSFNTSPGTHLRRWISQFCWSIFLCSATHFGGLNNHILLSIWVLELSNRATAHTHCHLRRVHERIPEIRLGVLGLRIPFGNLT